jgi:hypothetical protein
MTDEVLQRAWWKEPMVWLVAGLPMTAVIASFITYYIAASNPDTLVNAGYQKVGMTPDKDTSREQRAALLGIKGELQVVEGVATLRLAGNTTAMPAQLELLLLHPTQSTHDLRITLHSIEAGQYRGEIPADLSGGSTGSSTGNFSSKWQWILEPDDRTWRLAGRMKMPIVGIIKLGG